MIIRRGRTVRSLVYASVALAAALLTPPGRGQESPAPAAPARQTFTGGNGVKIEVRSEGPASDAEVLAALEEAARAVRSRAGRPPPDLPPPPPACAGGAAEAPGRAPALAEDGYGCGDDANVCRWRGRTIIGSPATLLWEPPLANPHEPRMRLVQSNLSDEFTSNTVDTSIGATIGLLRVTGDASGLSVQQDLFAVVQSRFSEHHEYVASDFRFGFPLTFAYGPWEAKVGYEHTSTHQGNNSIERLGRRLNGQVRDEAVLGLARWFLHDHFRVYGQTGYATLSTPGPDRDPARYDWGAEWAPRRSTGFWGQPFAAFDMELRGDQNFQADMTTQVGWQWRELGERLSSLRVGLEYYDGKSPYGTFFFQRERWVGVGLYVDY